MKKFYLKTFLAGIVALVFTSNYSFSQVAITAAGGGGSGTGGSIEFSIGQVSYMTIYGTGSVSEGAQQPYEIYVVTSLPDTPEINLLCSVFPNPTSGKLILSIDNNESKTFKYSLYDLNSKVLQHKRIINNETIVEMENLPQGIYLLKVYDSQQEIKTFKIIKN